MSTWHQRVTWVNSKVYRVEREFIPKNGRGGKNRISAHICSLEKNGGCGVMDRLVASSFSAVARADDERGRLDCVSGMFLP